MPFFLLLFSLLSQAQNDTAFLPDSLPPQAEEKTVTEEQTPPDITIEDKGNDYFLKKERSYEDGFIIQRKVPDSLVKKMQHDDAFWYANTEIKEDPEKDHEKDSGYYVPLGQRKWFQTLLWLLIIGGFAVGVIWYLAGTNVGLFRRKNTSMLVQDESELSTEDIFSINYQKEIDKAESRENYRLAVRLMFLRLLKDMSAKNIIQYKQDRTNFDYLLQLHSTGYYDNFFRITRNYEYSWYGQFEVSEEAYKIIRNEFNKFDRQVR